MGRTSDVVALACTASAGVHAGLVPEHLRESPELGLSFVVATGLLVATASVLAVRPDDRRASRAAAILLAGLIASYAASRTGGIPRLQPTPEHVDVLGLVTKAVEAIGLLYALGQTIGGRRPPVTEEVAR